jgi:hypothetical protein
MIKNSKNHLLRFQEWYLGQCDGVWEKRFGIKIDTIDNPGWSFIIDLNDTQLEKEIFQKLRKDSSKDNWVLCWKQEKQFQGGGGPENLIDLIETFVFWNDKDFSIKNPTKGEKDLIWLQKWYKSQCDGDWEHEYGISIETTDNPGWYITINLTGTDCEGHSFSPVHIEKDDKNWFYCLYKNDNFEASCGPCNIADVLDVFRNWVEK